MRTKAEIAGLSEEKLYEGFNRVRDERAELHKRISVLYVEDQKLYVELHMYDKEINTRLGS